MQKIVNLCNAMKTHEGWLPVGSQEAPSGSRSYRNHNPGNLRRSPFAYLIEDNFAVFESDELGIFAFIWDIYNKCTGNTTTGLNGESSIRDLIFKWAPPTDNNNSQRYVEAVCRMTGYLETMKLKELLK